MRFVIAGAGAIGGLFGAYLSRGGHEVVFVEPREEIVAAVNSQGIGVVAEHAEDGAEAAFTPARAVLDASEIESCDAVILAVKAFDTLAAMRAVAHLITQESPIITLQTTLGTIELMEKVERRRNILGGFTFMAAAALGPGRVRQGGAGITSIGELDGALTSRVRRLARAFTRCGLETEAVREVVSRLWCKVIVYAAINPVSAILRLKNGQLLEKMESISLMKRLIDEGRMVAESRGIELYYSDLYELLFDSCRRTSDNVSSMLQDLLSGRRTEIDFLNGALYRYGAERLVPVTTQQSVIELVRLLEKWGFERY
ncbi:MAG: 2-dehydropantoate 2-reductase [Desulfobacteraceae bacterium]|nr:2-dehydropantoate 2-reductase [Desulfobacteraceae bacterium]